MPILITSSVNISGLVTFYHIADADSEACIEGYNDTDAGACGNNVDYTGFI